MSDDDGRAKAVLHGAVWHVDNHRDPDTGEEEIVLQIELGHDWAVTLSIRDGAPPNTALWFGCGERDFADQTFQSFCDWLQLMVGAQRP